MDISKIIKFYEKDELWEPLRNVSFFVWGSGWHKDRHFKYYRDKSRAACFIIMNKDENLGLFLAFNKLENIFIETFNDYIKNPASIESRKNKYAEIKRKINLLYKKIDDNYLRKAKIRDLINLAAKATDAA